MKIYYVKLNNGQELLSETTKIGTGSTLKLQDPALIYYATDNAGNPSIQLSPFMPFAKEQALEVTKEDYIFAVESNDEAAGFYKKATNKETIITQPKRIILP